MIRFILRDDQWERIKDLVPGKVTDCGVTAKDNRLFVEGVEAEAVGGADKGYDADDPHHMPSQTIRSPPLGYARVSRGAIGGMRSITCPSRQIKNSPGRSLVHDSSVRGMEAKMTARSGDVPRVRRPTT
jgi:hypothetical protein